MRLHLIRLGQGSLAGALAALALLSAEARAAAGPVAAYAFDEPSGNVVTDASGEFNVGFIAGATRTAAGKHGGALSFDGLDDSVAVSDTGTFEEPGSLDPGGAVTLEAWVKPSAAGLSPARAVMLKERPGGFVYALYGRHAGAGPAGRVLGGVAHSAPLLPVDEWTHLATTYDGTTLRLLVNGTQVASSPLTGALENSSHPLKIGGSTTPGQWFAGLIDDVRVYGRALSAAELQADMATPVTATVQDEVPPTMPTNLAANSSVARADLTWTPATDEVGVAHYNVHRSTEQFFAPAEQNRVATTDETAYTDLGLPTGTHYYIVTAEDAAGNVSDPSDEVSVTVAGDTMPPSVSLDAPAAGAVVSNSVPVVASASDDVGVATVRFTVDGTVIAAPDDEAPFSLPWDTTGSANGPHVLRAIARDASGNETTSAPVTVTVDNSFAGFEDTVVAQPLLPTAMAFLPDGRMLIATKPGRLLLHEAGHPLATVLDLGGDGSPICTDFERGMLGVAVDPDWATDRHVYIYYTHRVGMGCVNRVARFTLSAAGVADPDSELVLIDGIPSTSGDHNAGDVQFGRDGLLYVSVGDGGCDYAGDSGCTGSNDASRDLHMLLGKVIRITKTGAIPGGNPFQGPGTARCSAGGTEPGQICRETYSWGLRNPFRMAFDPNAAGTRFFINDVGQNRWEEINEGQAGADFGWNEREGPCPLGTDAKVCQPSPTSVDPIYSYHHNTGCSSVTGGAFVPDGVWPQAFDGAYMFADYVCGKIFRLTRGGDGKWSAREFVGGLGGSSAVAMRFGPHDDTQALYYTTFAGGGQVRRIAYVGLENRTPVARAEATPWFGPAPLDVTLDASASHDPDGDTLAYAWDLDGDGEFDDSTAAELPWTYETPGEYEARVKVSDGRGGVAEASVEISAGNTPPEPWIDLAADFRFRVGQQVTLNGGAEDEQDGPLDGSRLSWRIVRHHIHNDPAHGGDHTHPLAEGEGASISFTAPAPEDLESTAGSHLEAILTAVDSNGVERELRRDVLPRVVTVNLATEPEGRRVRVNGADFTGPAAVTSWEGWPLEVEAVAVQAEGAQTWLFASWADGGPATRTIVTPAAAATYTAQFQRPPVAALAADPPSGAAPLPVKLDASGSSDPDGDALTYAWDLDGDGEFDDGTGAVLNGTFAASAQVRVRVRDGRGGEDVDTLTVDANRAPEAALAADPATGTAPLQVKLDATGSSDPDGDGLSFAWDVDGAGEFDDGTGAVLNRTFAAPAQIRVRVRDERGGEDVETIALNVNRGPAAALVASPDSGTAPLAVTLDATGSSDPDGDALAFAWDVDSDGFDDGTGTELQRTYGEAGDFGVRVRVRDGRGGEAIEDVTVRVAPPPDPPPSDPRPGDPPPSQPPPPPPAEPPVNLAVPAVAGTARVRSTLSVADGSWRSALPLSYVRAWQRCDAGGGSCADIAGATGPSYTLAPDDKGARVRVLVTALNAAGNAAAASAATAIVAAAPAIAGTAKADTLTGTDGDDVINGLGGDDRMLGLLGEDALAGAAGNDRASGGGGDDRVDGGAGNDTLDGGGGRDNLSGGAGKDTISARDGKRDRVRCGAGRDKVTADKIDSVKGDCERVRRG